jgi:hypothetical protein
MAGPVSFRVPLSAALAKAQANHTSGDDLTLDILVAQRAGSRGMAAMAGPSPGASEVTAMSLDQL